MSNRPIEEIEAAKEWDWKHSGPFWGFDAFLAGIDWAREHAEAVLDPEPIVVAPPARVLRGWKHPGGYYVEIDGLHILSFGEDNRDCCLFLAQALLGRAG